MVGDPHQARLLPSTATEGTTIDATELVSPAPPAPAVPPRPPGRPRGHIKEFGEGRVCGSSGCTTILSRYNAEGICWKHEQSARTDRS